MATLSKRILWWEFDILLMRIASHLSQNIFGTKHASSSNLLAPLVPAQPPLVLIFLTKTLIRNTVVWFTYPSFFKHIFKISIWYQCSHYTIIPNIFFTSHISLITIIITSPLFGSTKWKLLNSCILDGDHNPRLACKSNSKATSWFLKRYHRIVYIF